MNLPEVGCSPGESFERLYEEVFVQIYPQIKNQKKGVLSTVIYTILEADKSQAEQVCQHLQIDNNNIEDDLSISLDIIGLFVNNPTDDNQFIKSINKFVKDNIKNGRKSFAGNWEENEMKLYQIVVIGCLIVGVIACLTYLKTRQNKLEPEKDAKTPPPKLKIPQPAALCLVVPASAVRNIKHDRPINVSEIQQLIDNTSYYLCTNPQDANAIQKPLELTDEEITNASENTEVYVRINIDDGEKMIGKIPYILKKNLPTNGELVITELACLKYLSNSGLEKFNRV